MQRIDLKTILWQEGDHFVAQCLNVDVSSFGSSKQEALDSLQEALELFFEDASTDRIQTVQNPEIFTTSLARA